MDLTLILTIIGTGLGTTIAVVSTCAGLWMHSDSKFAAFQAAMNQEVKDFHARLAVQDAEFKDHVKYCHQERG